MRFRPTPPLSSRGSFGTSRNGPAVNVIRSGHLGTGLFLGAFQGRRSSRWIKQAKQSSHSNRSRFRYKKEIDPERTPEFGLVAEEVEKVNPDLVARDADGKALHGSLRRGERHVAQRVP